MFEKLKNRIITLKGKKPELQDFKDDNSVAYLSAEYLRDGKLTQFAKIDSVSDKYFCTENDLLIIWDGSNSGEVFMGKEGILSSTMAKIEVNDNLYLKKYLYYFLKNNFAILNEKVTGAAIPHLNRSTLENLEIYKASLAEQKEIVDVLDAADRIISLRTACIESAQDLIPALFQEMFGDPINNNKNWPIVKIDTVTNVISGGTPSTKIPEYWDGDIVWLTPKDLSGYNSVYISKGERNITDLGYKKSSAQIMPKGSVLFTSRAPIGYVAIADTDLCTNQGFKSFVPSIDIKSEYLYQLLKMMKPKILNMASGAVFKEISGSKIKELKIPLPNIELQNQFATKVQEIESYIKTQQAELENAKTMFQSLLHHSFTGELTRHKFGGDANG